MKNPFKLFKTNNVDRKKQLLEQNIKDKAFEITKLVVKRKLTLKEVHELEFMYKEYFKKYPDPKAEQNCKDRITKLCKIV